MYHRYVKIPVDHRKPSCFSHQPSQSEVIFVPKTDIDQAVINWIESFDVVVSNVTEGIYTPPNQPSLINVGQLHSTYNPDPTHGRWSLCYFLLNKDYTHLQFEKALNIFKEVTYE